MWREQARLSVSGWHGTPNEDGVVVRIGERKSLFAVLDGVSSIKGSVEGYKEGGEFILGGHWAMRRVQEFLEQVNLHAVEDAYDAVCQADEALDRAFQERGSRRDRRWRLPAVAAIVVVTDTEPGDFTWAQVADCMLMHERNDGARFVLENPMREIDAVTLQVLHECDGNPEDIGLKDALCAQYQGRNQPGSYPVLDGAVNRVLIRSGCLSLSGVQRFALWSDGLHTLLDDLHAVGSAILTEGLDAWYRRVVEREEADPKCMNPLRFKNDDKSGLVIERA